MISKNTTEKNSIVDKKRINYCMTCGDEAHCATACDEKDCDCNYCACDYCEVLCTRKAVRDFLYNYIVWEFLYNYMMLACMPASDRYLVM